MLKISVFWYSWLKKLSLSLLPGQVILIFCSVLCYLHSPVYSYSTCYIPIFGTLSQPRSQEYVFVVQDKYTKNELVSSYYSYSYRRVKS